MFLLKRKLGPMNRSNDAYVRVSDDGRDWNTASRLTATRFITVLELFEFAIRRALCRAEQYTTPRADNIISDYEWDFSIEVVEPDPPVVQPLRTVTILD